MISTNTYFILIISITTTPLAQNVTITRGPTDSVVCMNAMAPVDCGFTGTDPFLIIPNWRIVFRNNNGSVISNTTVDGEDILDGLLDGLQWMPDLTSGGFNAPNSQLLVGPVNMTHNQSSYQCIFDNRFRDSIVSSVGKMTIVDPPAITIEKDKICTTSVIISLIIDSHPSCGNILCNVIISGNVINPDTDDSSKYTIGELESNTTYKITVTFTYNNGFSSGEFNKFVKTALPKSPNPVSINTINITSEGTSVIVTWKPPTIDECYMLPFQRYAYTYEVIVYSGEVEVASENTINGTTFSFQHLNDQSNVTFRISITVIDIYGQRSNSTVLVIMKAFNEKSNINETIDELSTSKPNERRCEIFIGLAVVFMVISVITSTIIVILSWKLCCSQKKINDVVTIPPAQLQGQLIVDNIQM